MVQSPVPSFTKQGGIYIASCNTSLQLFPIHIHPALWPSCGDAYEYTWMNDFHGDIYEISDILRVKLARSMGFCPHSRCQLGNLSSSSSDGRCPDGLCYTKLENGSKSFGACCFINGKFSTGDLIGYFNKTQSVPKPIYKHSRVLLGGKGADDESKESFINANILFKGMIAAQCPLPNTVWDTHRMVVEQNVSLWIQLAPFWNKSESPGEVAVNDWADLAISAMMNSSSTNCKLYPNSYAHSSLETGANISLRLDRINPIDTKSLGIGSRSFYAQQFEIRYCGPQQHELVPTGADVDYRCKHHIKSRTSGTDEDDTNNAGYSLSSSYRQHVQHVRHLWYRHWEDFSVPPPDDDNDMLTAVSIAVDAIRDGGTVVVSCKSGRGRSGTFAALVAAQLQLKLGGSRDSSGDSTSISGKFRAGIGSSPSDVWRQQDIVMGTEGSSRRHTDSDSNKCLAALTRDQQQLQLQLQQQQQQQQQSISPTAQSEPQSPPSSLSSQDHVLPLTHEYLVDIIVELRRHRDGGVETPRQYRYAAELLGLPSLISRSNSGSNSSNSIGNSSSSSHSSSSSPEAYYTKEYDKPVCPDELRVLVSLPSLKHEASAYGAAPLSSRVCSASFGDTTRAIMLPLSIPALYGLNSVEQVRLLVAFLIGVLLTLFPAVYVVIRRRH